MRFLPVEQHAFGFLAAALVSAVLAVSPAAAQTPHDRASLAIPRTDRAPALEDFLDMAPSAALAGRLAKAEGFIQQTPSDGRPSSQRTDVYVAYDDRQLYVVFVAFDSEPGRIRARMARREAISDQDDWVEVALDTFHDQRRGYLFDANPLGVQWDALWSEANGEDASFDAVWSSRGRVTDRGYIVWMAIPFKSLRFSPDDVQTWGVTFTRWIPRVPEKSAWPRVSTRVQGRMNQAATMTGLEGISPGRHLQFIPYGVLRSFRLLDEDADPPGFVSRRAETDGGLDAKLVMKDSLVLDLAVNPDFSQVESDEPQRTVNQRFEVFFPERRPFFVENASFFRTPINLLFTRRIADPQFGVRLTGKAGAYSIGALVADDQAPGRAADSADPLHGARAHFAVVRLSRDVFRQGSVGLIYTDRGFGGRTSRVGGLDVRMPIGENWVTSAQAVRSSLGRADGTGQSGAGYRVTLERVGRQFESDFEYNDRSPGFHTDAGFLRRNDVRQFREELSWRWRPEGPFLIAWGPESETDLTFDHGGTRLDLFQQLSLAWELVGQTEVVAYYRAGRERLRPEDFDGLPAARDYRVDFRGFDVTTDYVPWMSAGFTTTWETVINVEPPEGDLPETAAAVNGEARLTLRPSPAFRIDHAWLFERVAERGTGRRIYANHILRSKWTYQFTHELSARVILQYDAVRPDAALTALEHERNLNADFLATWLLNPWTALHVGYNSNLRNVALVSTASRSEVIRTDRLERDARGLFVKMGYLIRF